MNSINTQYDFLKKSKKIIFLLSMFLVITIFIFSGCQSSFKHKTIYFSPQENDAHYSFEVTVTKVDNDYFPDMYSRALDVEIQIKTIAEEGLIDCILRFNDFEFYINKNYTILKTYMYTENPNNEVEYISLKVNTTKTLHLRINYKREKGIGEKDIGNDYVIKLLNKRI